MLRKWISPCDRISMAGIYCFHFHRLTQWPDCAVWTKVTRQCLIPNSQECTHWQASSHYQGMISGPIVTVTGPSGELSILISKLSFSNGASMHYLFVSTVLQCISSSACRKTFSFTGVSATLSRLTRKKILPTIQQVHHKTLLIFCKEIRDRPIFIKAKEFN